VKLVLASLFLAGCSITVPMPPGGEQAGRYGAVTISAHYFPALDLVPTLHGYRK
jgi:hypothetical protein